MSIVLPPPSPQITSEISHLLGMKVSNAVDAPLRRSFLCNISCTSFTALQNPEFKPLEPQHWGKLTSLFVDCFWTWGGCFSTFKSQTDVTASEAANSTTWAQQTKRDWKTHQLPGLRTQLWTSLHPLNSSISVTTKLLTTTHKSWGTKINFLYLVVQTFQSATIFWFCFPCIFREQTIFTSSKA